MTRLLATIVLAASAAVAGEPLVYAGGDGPGEGTHVVLLAGDHEYRSEETIPALARILSERHGFRCTVLFTTDPKTGDIKPGSNHLPGTEILADADCCVIFMRYQNLPREQMLPIVDYLKRGGPMVGLRTSTHAFKIPKGSEFERFDEKWKGEDFYHGFGRQILGETWVTHYGRNHVMSTRLDIVPENASHPVLTGIEDVDGRADMWVEAGGYWVEPKEDCTVLAESIPLESMDPTAPPAEGKEWCPGAWTRTYTFEGGPEGRVFNTTYGASEDLRNEPFRRMLVNAVFWASGLEDRITPDLSVDFVGPYNPSRYGFNEHRLNVKPREYADLSLSVPPTDRPLAPGRPKRKKK